MVDRYTETVLTNIGLNIIMTLSVYCPLAVGQLSIAQVGFMAIGAHLATVLTLYLHVPFELALLAAGILPWGVGLLFGRMIARLQGLTLAFATFAFMEVVQVFFLNFTPTGDARGIKGIEPLTELWHVWAIVAALMLFFCRLRRSRIGRAMAMVKHDEVVAQSLGVHVQRLKMLAFAMGALVAGVGGGLYAHFAMYIQYSDFGADRALAILTYAVFGGIDVWSGGVLGAAVLSYMPVLLQVFDHWRLEVHGALILIVMGLRPQGVLALDLCDTLQRLRQRWRPPHPLSLPETAGVRELSPRR
jgi:branched-chain amino acid transport system permease protein